MDTHKEDIKSDSSSMEGKTPDATVPVGATSTQPAASSATPPVSSSSPEVSSEGDKPKENTSTTPPPLSPSPSISPKTKKGMSLPLIIVFLILSFLGGLLIAGWYFQTQLQKFTNSAPATKAENKVSPAAASETLLIGTDATAPPMESLNDQGGLIGYDIDLGYRVANELGMKAEFKNIPWENIFTDLENGKIDMIISSVTINEERKQKYAFSEPYINAGQVIVSRKDNPITSTAGLKGKKISAQKGTTCEKEAYKYTDANLVIIYEQFIDAASAVSKGIADATICDLTLAKGYIDQYENLKITSDPFTNEYYGIVIRKDNTELLKKVNEAIAVLRVKGILTDLKQKWLE